MPATKAITVGHYIHGRQRVPGDGDNTSSPKLKAAVAPRIGPGSISAIGIPMRDSDLAAVGSDVIVTHSHGPKAMLRREVVN